MLLYNINSLRSIYKYFALIHFRLMTEQKYNAASPTLAVGVVKHDQDIYNANNNGVREKKLELKPYISVFQPFCFRGPLTCEKILATPLCL